VAQTDSLRSSANRADCWLRGLICAWCYQKAVGMGGSAGERAAASLHSRRASRQHADCYIATRASWNGGLRPDAAGRMRASVWLCEVAQERDTAVQLPWRLSGALKSSAA
jgi:hypothetical protein